MHQSKETDKKREENKKPLPFDFYMENGRKVMTEEYHIRRGYCCGSGCRHCAYEPKAVKGNTTLRKNIQ